MPIVQLTEGQRSPIAALSKAGPKTVKVYAAINWPAAVGQQAPSIPNDILIEVRTKYKGIYSTDIFSLPAVGAQKDYLADDISIYATYSTQQDDIPYYAHTAYVTYMIHGEIIEEFVPKSPLSHSFKLPEYYLPISYPDAGRMAIPSFVTEFRVKTNALGSITMFEPDGVGAQQFAIVYDLAEISDWTPIQPECSQYRYTIDAWPYGEFPWSATYLRPVSFTTQFR